MESAAEDATTLPNTLQALEEPQTPWNRFKIVGDNIDKTVYALFQRSDDQMERSLHHFHA